MFLIRQSFLSDQKQMLEVARHLDTVNLPADASHIENILARSAASFDESLPASEREYVFVLVESSADRIIGTAMIHAQHGTRRAPHVFFRVFKDERYSQTLDRYFVHRALRLGYNYDGPTELCGLIVLPEYRRHPARPGKLASFVRFPFIAMHRPVFRDRVLAELLPPLEPDGTSVLWEHLGHRFTGLTYQEADLLSKDNKEFITALFPHNVIHTSLLPVQVQEAIGRVGPNTVAVEKMLRSIGFSFARQIDPFDGGPHFVAKTDKITLVQQSREVTVTEIEGADTSRPWAIIAVEGPVEGAIAGAAGATGSLFRATGARVIPSPDGASVGLTPAIRELLAIAPGDRVWMVIP